MSRTLTVIQQMTEQFQCPGCVVGSDIECGRYKESPSARVCQSHVLGTNMYFGGCLITIALGLPRGFNRSNWIEGDSKYDCKMDIRFWPTTDLVLDLWDNFNVPVWAMVKDGDLFVRTYAPRIGKTFLDVVRGGTLELVPNAIDVGQFYHEID